MNNQSAINFTNASLTLIGESKLARQRSVAVASPASVVTASFNLGGKIGKEIRNGAIFAGRMEIQRALQNGNFKPLAQFLALQFGESVYVKNQAEFFALDNRMQTHVDNARSGKNLGMIVNKKTGAERIGTKLADALELQSFVVDLIAMTKAAIAEVAAAKDAELVESVKTSELAEIL